MDPQFEKRAVRDLDRLDVATRERILAAIAAYVAGGSCDWRKLAGFKNRYRLRVGAFRVVFELESDESGYVMRVMRVSDRKDAYR